MTTRRLTCHELDERLGDYLEGTLDDSSVADIELHVSGCAECAQLVRDFERIVRESSRLAPPTPSRDLWAGIESRISAPVSDLSSFARARAAGTGEFRRRVRSGAIAAGLMAVTATATWFAARSRESPAVTAATSLPAAAAAQGPSPDSTPASERVVEERSSEVGADPAGAGVRTTLAARPTPERSPEATYVDEISELRGTLQARRDALDPRTVAVIESSIATIDSAIAQARTALRRDPSSRFLSEQLNKALGKKLGLLRTAALLPSRT